MSEARPERKGSSPQRRAALLATAALVLAALVAVTVHYVANIERMRDTGHPPTCMSNLYMISLACHMYADENDGQFPQGLQQLAPKYVENPRRFKCPFDSTATYRDFEAGGRVTAKSSSYVYVRGLRADMPAGFVLAFDKLRNHTREETGEPRGRNVLFLFVDAHAEWWPAEREAEFQKKLAAQREAIRKWRAAGAKVEDMGEFFGKPRKQ